MTKRILCVLLSVAMVLSMLSGCGKKESNIHTVEVTIKDPEGIRAVVQTEIAVIVPAYLSSMAYYNMLRDVDLDNFDANQYMDMLNKAERTLDITEKLAKRFNRDCKILAALEDAGIKTAEPAKMKEIACAPTKLPAPYADPFTLTVYAKDKSASLKWAEDLTKTFDSAPFGHKLQAVADAMGTDVKHAKVAIGMAQDIISGDGYVDEAAVANTCYQGAVVLKASAAIGVAVCSGGVAAAAAATATPAAAALATAGVVCNGVNAVLDTGSAVTIVATNGEGNEYTEAFQNTSTQFAPISFGVGLLGAASNITNIASALKNNDPNITKVLAEEGGQLVTFIGSELVNYRNDNTVAGGTFTKTKEGWKFTLVDTLLGKKPEEKKAAVDMLKQLGVNEAAAKGAIDIVTNDLLTEEEAKKIIEMENAEVPPEAIIDMWDGFNDEDAPFDEDAYLDVLQDMMEDAIEDAEENDGFEFEGWDAYDYADDEDNEDYDEDNEDYDEDDADDEADSDDSSVGGWNVAGEYSMTITPAGGIPDPVDASVILSDDNSMIIEFATHCINQDLTSLDMNRIAEHVHLVGKYNPSNKTFTGRGTGEVSGEVKYKKETIEDENGVTFDIDVVDSGGFLSDSYWNIYDTVITFDESGKAHGTLATGERIMGMSCESSITMEKICD